MRDADSLRSRPARRRVPAFRPIRTAAALSALTLAVAAIPALGGCGGSDRPASSAGSVTGGTGTTPGALGDAVGTGTGASGTTPGTTTAATGRTTTTRASRDAAAAASAVQLPPRHVRADYQIGGAYRPRSGTRLVVRDRQAAPVSGVYSICYVNAYQAQPHELSWWRRNHPTLLLRDGSGDEVVDEDWNEVLLDISTDAKRRAIARIAGGWFAGCARAGFRGVEPDNLDSWTRSGGRLDRADAIAMARLLVREAHGRGLAIGQKNTVEISTTLRSAGYDFAVAEECTRYRECGGYARAYPGRVLVIEYRRADFTTACADPAVGGALSVVLRDVDVSTPSDSDYVYGSC